MWRDKIAHRFIMIVFESMRNDLIILTLLKRCLGRISLVLKIVLSFLTVTLTAVGAAAAVI